MMLLKTLALGQEAFISLSSADFAWLLAAINKMKLIKSTTALIILVENKLKRLMNVMNMSTPQTLEAFA